MITEMTRNDVFGRQVIVDKIQRLAFITIVVIKMDIGQDHEDESSIEHEWKVEKQQRGFGFGQISKVTDLSPELLSAQIFFHYYDTL